jgi:hypothetical protein
MFCTNVALGSVFHLNMSLKDGNISVNLLSANIKPILFVPSLQLVSLHKLQRVINTDIPIECDDFQLDFFMDFLNVRSKSIKENH